MDLVPQDVRYAARTLRAHPSFAVAAIATLGLAIAAAVTAFSFADAIFLRPLPAPEADRLVRVYLGGSARHAGDAVEGTRLTSVGNGGVALLRQHRDVFDHVAGEACCWVKFVRERGSLDQRYTAYASAEFFPMFGLSPRLGRFFTPGETSEPGRDPVAVISYALWRSTFGQDPHVAGERIDVGGHPFTIVGVAPEGFDGIGVGATRSELWLPTSMMGAVGIGCAVPVPCDDANALARLAPGITLAQARAAVGSLGGQLSRLSLGDDSVRQVRVLKASGADVARQRQFAPLARLLGAIAALLLLVACANLGGLLLARGVSREREIAVRVSLGAGRRRIVRQLLTESALVAVAGGALGVLVSVWTARGLRGFFASDAEGFENFYPLALNVRVVWFAVLASAGATLLFALLPALTTARANAADVLRRTSGGSQRGRARLGLIAAQVALTSTLLCGAALLSRSFAHLLHAQRFDASHVALLRVRPAAARYEPARAQAYVRVVRDQLAVVPGVQSVAFARGVGLLWSGSPVERGVGASAADTMQRAEMHFVSPGFFSTLKVPLLQGREFGGGDYAGAPLVAVVSESVVRRLWSSGDPIGRLVYAGGKIFRVVGVVPDYQVRVAGGATPPMFFASFWQNALGQETDARFAIRVSGDPDRMLAALRRAAVAVDPNVPVAEVMTMARQMDASYPEIRLGQTVLLSAGGLALFLCAVGLYGTIAFLVARRTREIGIRMALGAVPRRMVLTLVWQGMRAAAIGVGVGLVGAFVASRLLSSWLVGVPPRDVVAFAAAASSVLVVTVVAAAIPARRAATIDPGLALRAE